MTLHSGTVSPRSGITHRLTPPTATVLTCEGGDVVSQREKSWSGVSAQLAEICCRENLRVDLGAGCARLCVVLEEVGGRFTVRTKDGSVQNLSHERPLPLSLITADLEAYGSGDHMRFVRLLLLRLELPALERMTTGEIDLSHAFAPRLMFDDPSIMSLVQLFAAECADDKRYSRLYGDNLSIALLLALSRLSTRTQSPVPGGRMAPWQLRRVTEHMTAHLADKVEMEAVCDLVKLSRSHFIRAFKMSTGLPPRQWLLHARIAKAKELLLASDQPLSQIATDVGFSDQAHFSRTFRVIAGESPGAWQRARRPCSDA